MFAFAVLLSFLDVLLKMTKFKIIDNGCLVTYMKLVIFDLDNDA